MKQFRNIKFKEQLRIPSFSFLRGNTRRFDSSISRRKVNPNHYMAWLNLNLCRVFKKIVHTHFKVSGSTTYISTDSMRCETYERLKQLPLCTHWDLGFSWKFLYLVYHKRVIPAWKMQRTVRERKSKLGRTIYDMANSRKLRKHRNSHRGMLLRRKDDLYKDPWRGCWYNAIFTS